MKKLLLILLAAVLLASGWGCSQAAPEITNEPELQARLDKLVEQMEQQRQTLHIPGMALAVVKDDKVVLLQGFGVADVEEGTAVTPETVFAIGSSTKAFTSTLVGMMVDEGKMSWDDPVADYLPYFQLAVESANPEDEITLRDALSHRTGFTRMGLLFGSGEIPREEILQDAALAKPYVGFREKFYYSNVVYMSAGVAAGEVAGNGWDELVKERIFEPLGMDSSTTALAEAQKDSRLALGYLWDEDLETYNNKPMRNVDNIGPAGSINSNVIDMAEWLRFQLGDGTYEGKQLISAERLHDTWDSQIEIGGGVSYGMGWMIRQWQGLTVIEHGGNVDGFSAEVAMLPEEELGFVLLTNATVTTLQQSSINMVWDAILGEEDTGEAIDYEEYTGNYIANFGTFKNTVFEVLVQNGRLAVDIPGQMVYELKNPDAAGRWVFAITDEISVSFERNEAGQVTGMKMNQSGMTFDLPKEGFEAAPEIPLGELEKYLGSYLFEMMGVTTEVLIQNNRLAIDIPGQMVFELYPPDEEGFWVFRVSPEIKLKFNESADGQIESVTISQSGMEFLLPLVEGRRLPTVDEIMALRDTEERVAALATLGNYRGESSIYSEQSGVRGTITTWVGDGGRYRAEGDYGKYGHSTEAVDGARAWSESSFGPFEELHGILLEQALMGHPAVMEGDWREHFDVIEVLRADTLNGKDVYVLEMRHGELPAQTVYVDAATGDVLMTLETAMQEGGIGIPITTRYEDYQEFAGLRIAYRTISSNEQSGRIILELGSIETNLSLDNSLFVLTPPEP